MTRGHCADCGDEKRPGDPKGDYCRPCHDQHSMFSEPILLDARERGFVTESDLRAEGITDLGLAAEECGTR